MEDGNLIDRFTLGGYNPNYSQSIVLIDILYKELRQDFPAVDAVYYYGSGCGNDANKANTAQYLKVRFEEAKTVVVDSDMMGAAIAVLGHQPGISCILGTGANSCCYDGHAIVDRAVSLGYLVGDEGSGCYIGRKLTRAYFYELMPADLRQSFDQTYHLTVKEFVEQVYHQPGASKYLARFTKFAGEHLKHPFIQQLLKECFGDFIKAFVLRYDDCHNLPVSFVGSVAYYFEEPLRESLESEGLTMGKVMRSPLEGLIQMYS